jgi:hypothetical protein
MHTDNLRPFILNARVQLDALRAILIPAGDHAARSIGAIISPVTCSHTAARYTCNDTTARDRCGLNSCNNGHMAKSILHRRNRARERSRIIFLADARAHVHARNATQMSVRSHTPAHTFTYTHATHIRRVCFPSLSGPRAS